MNRLLICSVFCFLTVACATALPNIDTLWTRTYGGIGWDEAHAIQQTTDGGFIVVGKTDSYGAGSYDIWVVKTNSNGDSLWTRTFGTYHAEDAFAVRQTSDGGYIVTGEGGADRSDLYVIRLNSQGSLLWQRFYGDNNADFESARDVKQTTDGGFILAGNCGGGYWLVKLNSNGDTLWTRWEGYYGTDARSVLLANGGYLLVGTHDFGDANGSDVRVIRTNSNGDTLWTRRYGTTADESAMAARSTADGGFIVCGDKDYMGRDSAFVVKADASGNQQWMRAYGWQQWDLSPMQGEDVLQTPDGGYMLVCEVSCYYGPGQVCPGIGVVRLSQSGDTVWTREYGYDYGDDPHSIALCSDGGFVIAGQTIDSDHSAGSFDFLVVRVSSGAGVDDMRPAFPVSLNLFQNYPNPFNPTTEIRFDLARAGKTSLKVYDLLGREVTELMNEILPAGTHHATFNASNLASGIYIYRLQTGAQTQSRKMVVLK